MPRAGVDAPVEFVGGAGELVPLQLVESDREFQCAEGGRGERGQEVEQRLVVAVRAVISVLGRMRGIQPGRARQRGHAVAEEDARAFQQGLALEVAAAFALEHRGVRAVVDDAAALHGHLAAGRSENAGSSRPLAMAAVPCSTVSTVPVSVR